MSREGLIKASKSVVHYILCNDTLPLKIFALVPQFLNYVSQKKYKDKDCVSIDCSLE